MDKNFYNRFHSASTKSRFLLKDSDFTYSTLINLVNFYSKTKMKTLDIGCGVGLIDQYMALKGCKVTCTDISKKAIQVAKKNIFMTKPHYKPEFLVGDFIDLNFKTKFDLIICSEVLEHVVDDGFMVKKMSKILKKNGIIIASSPSKNAPLFRLGLLNKFDINVGHVRRYTPNEFIKLFGRQKLEVLRCIKTEGLLRNVLFTSGLGGILLKFVNKFNLGKIISHIDSKLIDWFGESNIYLVLKKS